MLPLSGGLACTDGSDEMEGAYRGAKRMDFISSAPLRRFSPRHTSTTAAAKLLFLPSLDI
jgi:hypothetical protein